MALITGGSARPAGPPGRRRWVVLQRSPGLAIVIEIRPLQPRPNPFRLGARPTSWAGGTDLSVCRCWVPVAVATQYASLSAGERHTRRWLFIETTTTAHASRVAGRGRSRVGARPSMSAAHDAAPTMLLYSVALTLPGNVRECQSLNSALRR